MFGCQQNNQNNLCLVQDLLKLSPSWLISTIVLPIISYSISLGLPLPSLHLLSPWHVVSAAPPEIRGPPAQRPGRTSPDPPSAARLCRKEWSIWSQTHRSPGRPLWVAVAVAGLAGEKPLFWGSPGELVKSRIGTITVCVIANSATNISIYTYSYYVATWSIIRVYYCICFWPSGT